MRRAVVIALAIGLGLDLVVLVLAASLGDRTAVTGALIGTGLTLVVILPTLAVVFLARRMTPVTMAAVVLGSWAAKMLVVIVVLLLVRDLPGVSAPWLGAALLVGAVSAVLGEGVLLARTRQPLDVEPPTLEENDS